MTQCGARLQQSREAPEFPNAPAKQALDITLGVTANFAEVRSENALRKRNRFSATARPEEGIPPAPRPQLASTTLTDEPRTESCAAFSTPVTRELNSHSTIRVGS
jgi:hypothetical protein